MVTKDPKNYVRHQNDLKYKKRALDANEKNIFRKKHLSAAHAGLFASLEDSDHSAERPKL